MKRIALIAAVGLASLATLPYSLPVLVVAAVVVHYRRQRVAVPRSVLFRQELDALEARLREEVRETETLAKIRYTKWKLDKEAEKRHYITHGVHFPRTRWQDEQDRFFAELEKRMATEQQRFAEDAHRIEHAERLKIEDQRRQAGARPKPPSWPNSSDSLKRPGLPPNGRRPTRSRRHSGPILPDECPVCLFHEVP